MRKILRGLPTTTAASLGRIVSRWAYQEYLLYMIAYMACGVDPKRGRIAVRQGPIREQLSMIEDLMALQGVRFRKKYIAGLTKQIDSVKTRRDALAHSVWLETERGPAIQDTKGEKWNVQGPPAYSWRTTKRMKPGLTAVDRAYLKTLREDLLRLA